MPPAGPFLNDQKGAKESVKEGDFDFPLLDNPPLETTKHRGDCGPPYWKYPPGSSTAASVSTGGLRCHAASAGEAGAPPQQWRPWPNSKAFSPDKTVPPSIQGRHAHTPRLVHKAGGGKIGAKLFSVPPAQAVTAGAGPRRERKDVSRRIFFASVSVEP